MKRIAVFCGASSGSNSIYKESATHVGQVLAQQQIELVYGGASIGIMGAVADSILAAGGKAIGVLPSFFTNREVAHEHLTQMIIVETMHERKMTMHDLSDGIIALPGGFGTMEELFEILTWGQLGLHQKPMGLLNVNGFYDPLIRMMDHMVSEGFLMEINRKMVLISDDIEALLVQMREYQAPALGQWLKREGV